MSTNKPQIPYVTTNKGKFKDIQDFLSQNPDLPMVVTQKALEIDEFQSDDQLEIVQKKAIAAWNELKTPLLIEDAGIFFEKYHNFPGTFSKYIFKSLGFEGLTKLYEPGDKAYFKLMLCYIENPESLHFFEGRCEGKLILPHIGANASLPYQVLFVPNGATKTYQQLSDDGEKTPFAFRIKAFKAFTEWHKNL